jgi:hypothetical protein
MKPVARPSLLLILALLISLAPLLAQTAPTHAPGSLVRFLHLSLDDGLSQNAGLDVLQDSRGFV